jgi:hypothetical protein
MPVTEPQRLDLHAAARAALGPEEGDTLMASLPPANTDIATRQDLERVETSLQKDISRVETSLQKDISRVEESVQKDIARVEASLQKDIVAAESRMRTYVWKVVVGTGFLLFVGTVGTMIAGYAALSDLMQQMIATIERT